MTQPSIAPAPVNPRLRQISFVLALLISLGIFVMHFDFLTHAGGLWRDEVNLVHTAGHHSLGDLAKDSFPVLMPLLVKLWAALGLAQSDVSLRLLGIFICLAGVIGLWVAAWQAGKSLPLISLVLFGLNSTLIVFGDSIRPYGLGCTCLIFAVAAAWFFLKNPSWCRTAILALAAICSVQALFHNAVLVGAICLGATAVCLRRRHWRNAGQVLLAGFLAAMSLVPYLKNLLHAGQSGAVLHTGISWAKLPSHLATVLGFPWESYIYVWILLCLVVFAAVATINWRNHPEVSVGILEPDELRLFGAVALGSAILGFAIFLCVAEMPGQPWYFLPIMALAVMCFDATVWTLPSLARVATLIAVFFTTAVALPVTRHDVNYRFTNEDIWSQSLMAGADRQDFIMVTPWFYGVTFDYYFHGATPWNTLPPLVDHSTHRYDLVRDQLQSTNVLAPILENVQAALESGHHVWLLAPHGALTIPHPGASAPADLPPAPLPDTGWSDDPYNVVWTLQTMQFLSDHSRTFGLVKDPDAGQHTAEDLELFMAEGWRNLSMTTNSHAQ